MKNYKAKKKDCLKKNPDVILREEDSNGALLFNPETNQVLVLNTSGLFIWNNCDGKKDFQEILCAVKNAFDEIPQEEVSTDVGSFIDQLQQKGFIGSPISNK